MAAATTTLTYRWPAGGIVSRIDVREQSDGRAVAYLYADPSDAARPSRQALRDALRLKGWGTLSDYRDGAYALRISGFSNADELMATLKGQPFLQGEPEKLYLGSAPQSQSLTDRIRGNSLRASGILYSVGNVIYLASGLLRSHEEALRTGTRGNQSGQIGSALLWGSGDVLIATMGGANEPRQYNALLNKLHQHYQQNGIEVPTNAALTAETRQQNPSAFASLRGFVQDHLNQIKCASEALAAVFYFKAGKQQNNFWKQVTAVIFGTGFSASLLIPERKIDPEQYAQASGLQKLWMKIQSRPLSVGGISGYSNTVLTTVSAYKEGQRYQAYRENPSLFGVEKTPPSKYYKLDYAAPAVMFFGNSLYAMSKKNGGDIRSNAMVDDVYIVAAQVLNKQPENLREAAIESTAKFLGTRPEINDTRIDIIEKLRAQMEIQRSSPWFEKTPLPAYTPQPKRGRSTRSDGVAEPAAANDNPPTVVQASGAQVMAEKLAAPAAISR